VAGPAQGRLQRRQDQLVDAQRPRQRVAPQALDDVGPAEQQPACGPPSSLSPLAVTTDAPARSAVAASGSSGSSGCGASRPLPVSATTGTPSVASSATPTALVKPSTRKLLGCTFRTQPVSGPIASA
jgi:hypothetical protein